MLQLHERLGDFEIIRLLGKGGMGEVYEARQSNPDRPVAVKVLNKRLAGDDDSLRRFWKEAEVPANLDHPGIVRIISTGKTPDGIAYFAMHLVRGISLSEMIKRAGEVAVSDAATRTVESVNTPSAAAPVSSEVPPVSPAPAADSIPPLLQDYKHDRYMAVARIGAQAARALAYAHEQGFLHRDIKPSNLMVDMHNQVYLVDFGLTRGLEPAADSTQPGTLVGTPWYMSPEQADLRPVDARSDIYSLGVTLYELATAGLGPFTAARDDKSGVLAQVRAGQALPLRTLAAGIPTELERIILKAMEHRPKRRYATVAEMAHDLEVFCGHSGKHSSRPTLKPVARVPRWTWPLVVGGLFLAAAAGILLAVAIPWRAEPPVEKISLDGSRAFPEILRDKSNLGSRVPLFDFEATPRWSERFSGSAKAYPAGGNHLAVPKDLVLALADPDMSNFIFETDLTSLTDDFEGGVFFGLQRRSQYSSAPYHFFVITVSFKPIGDDQFGRMTIGTASVTQGNEAIGGGVRNWGMPLGVGVSTIGLTERDTKTWPKVTITVHGEHVEVKVPARKAIGFSLADLRRHDLTRFKDLRTSGAVGIWTKNGVGAFHDAALTPLRPASP